MIKDYDIGVTIGQAIGKVIDVKGCEDFAQGKFDELTLKVFERSLILKIKAEEMLKSHPILSTQLDPIIKYKDTLKKVN